MRRILVLDNTRKIQKFQVYCSFIIILSFSLHTSFYTFMEDPGDPSGDTEHTNLVRRNERHDDEECYGHEERLVNLEKGGSEDECGNTASCLDNPSQKSHHYSGQRSSDEKRSGTVTQYEAFSSEDGMVPTFNLSANFDNESQTYSNNTYSFSAIHDGWIIESYLGNITSPLSLTLRAEPNMNNTYKFFVLESDDWLSYSAWEIRNMETKEALQSMNYSYDSIWDNDSFETVEDLEMLFSVLKKHGVVMTPGIVTTVPDFDAIANTNYSQYVGVNISQGLPAYLQDRSGILEKHREGFRSGVWMPQYHGSTHFNTEFWLQQLRNGDVTALDHFNKYVIRATDSKRILSEYNQFLGGVPQFTYDFQFESMKNGLEAFNHLFNFNSTVNVAVPNYKGDENTARALRDNGLIGLRNTMSYWDINGTRKYVGFEDIRSNFNLVVLETGSASQGTMDWYYLEHYLQDNMTLLHDKVNTTFEAHQPFIEISHRLNYVSTLAGTDWRNSHLEKLDSFFTWLHEYHPDTIFLSSPELAQIEKFGYSIQPWNDNTVIRNYLRTSKILRLGETERPVSFTSWSPDQIVIKERESGECISFALDSSTIIFEAKPGYVYDVFESPLPSPIITSPVINHSYSQGSVLNLTYHDDSGSNISYVKYFFNGDLIFDDQMEIPGFQWVIVSNVTGIGTLHVEVTDEYNRSVESPPIMINICSNQYGHLCSQSISIHPGWNVISVNVALNSLGHSYKASVFSRELNSQAGMDAIKYIVSWNGITFEEYVVFTDQGVDFPIELLKGYFIFSASDFTFEFSIIGDCHEGIIAQLDPCWNLIGLSGNTAVPPSRIQEIFTKYEVDQIVLCIAKYDGRAQSNYILWNVGDPDGNIILMPGEGFWIFIATPKP